MTGDVFTAKVEGLSELREALLDLPVALQAGPLRRGVGAMAEVVRKRAIELAPEDEGTLKRAIYRAPDREDSSPVQEAYIVSVRYGKRYRRRGMDAWYWWHLEFGTSRMAAKSFMRPAFDATKTEQIEALRVRLAADLALIAAKLRRQLKRRQGR